jgi:hypothetical protein
VAVDISNSDIADAIKTSTGMSSLRFQLKKYRLYGPIAGATGAADLTVIDSASGKAFVDAGSFSHRAKVGVVMNRVEAEAIRADTSGSAVCNVNCAPDGDVIFQASVVVW